MKSTQNTSQDLLNYLQINGPTLSSELTAHFGISRPTLSRRVRKLGNAVVTIGRARATQLAARHPEAPSATPIYRIQENGQRERIGELTAIRDGEHTQWLLASDNAPKTFFEGEFKDGLYPGWPWFLEDLRPAGFLGRSFGQHMAELSQVDENPDNWSDLELLKILISHGSSLHGNLILGNGGAFNEYQADRIKNSSEPDKNDSPEAYEPLADFTLAEGEAFGSSAGGEQPKFTTSVCDQPDEPPRSVIVKFSPQLNTPSGQRWADLLYAEHMANQVLREAGFNAAQTRIFQLDTRVFLESERFDRMGANGRRGLISLRALDAAHIGMGQGNWTQVARRLHAEKWITEDDCQRMICLHCFGELIANTDMHWGNLSFFLPEQRPFPLAPVYDMLPMRFRPSSTGEIIARDFQPKLPKPEDQDAWLEMHPHALTFWQHITEHPEITNDFKTIARNATESLQQLYGIVRAR